MGRGEILKGSMSRENKAYVITSLAGTAWIRPRDLGLKPFSRAVGGMGYWCTYEVIDDRLRLRELRIEVDAATCASLSAGGTLLGRKPVPVERYPHNWRVEGLDIDVPFTGGLIIAADRFDEPPWYPDDLYFEAVRYRTVIEMAFDQGRLLETHDRSAMVDEVRAAIPEYEDGRSFADEMKICRSSREQLMAGLLHGYGPPLTGSGGASGSGT